MAKYLVTAHCNNSDCKTTKFKLMRRKMTYMGNTEGERVIDRVVCPDCRMLGFVDKMVSVDAGKKVA